MHSSGVGLGFLLYKDLFEAFEAASLEFEDEDEEILSRRYRGPRVCREARQNPSHHGGGAYDAYLVVIHAISGISIVRLTLVKCESFGIWLTTMYTISSREFYLK